MPTIDLHQGRARRSHCGDPMHAFAALLALASAAHASEFDESNFKIACVNQDSARVEACGIALRYGFDVFLSVLSDCIKTGATGDKVIGCVKGQATRLGFQ
jgi:hypothetical protein